MKRTESPGLMGRWGRAYLVSFELAFLSPTRADSRPSSFRVLTTCIFLVNLDQPFASRPSSRSSSISTTSWHGRPFTSAPPTIPTGIHTPRRSPSSSSTPWSSHLGKTPATLGLITPTLEILSWPLSPDPSTSSSRPHRQHHARIHRTSLLLQRPIAKSSTLSAPAYPSPAGSDTTIRPSRVSYYPTCSPPPFRRAHSSTSSTSSEEDSIPSSEPTSYSSYLRAGRPSPDGDRDRDRTPRADGRGGRRWAEQTSPTRLRRGEKVPSLSFTTGSSRSSVSVSVGGSPTDVFSVRAGRGGGLKGSGS